MNPLGKAIAEWEDHKEKDKKLQNAIVAAIFETCPAIQSFQVGGSQGISLLDVNEISWEGCQIHVAAIAVPHPETESFKGWLVQANITSVDFSRLILGLRYVQVNTFYKREYRREDYLAKETYKD